MPDKNVRILAIDDKQDNLTVLKALIKDTIPDAMVFTALNGKKGIELAHTENPDVILLDIIMPGMDGYEVCRQLKADNSLKDIPVVFLTAMRTDHESRIRALKMGAEAFLCKPIAEAELVAHIRAMAKIKNAHDYKQQEKEHLAILVEERTRELRVEITERRKAEEKIKQAAEEWRTTFDSITDLVSICDKDCKILRVNQAFADAFKMKPAELIGENCYGIAHGTNKPLPNCPQKVTIKTKKPAVAEFFEPLLGIHLEVSTSPIFNKKGEVVSSVHIIRDITERKKMEGQLLTNDRLASLGELVSGVAHELNNPLTSVIGFSELLAGRNDLPDDIKMDLEVINKEAQRTASIVKNLLTFARKQPKEKQLTDINSAIKAVLELRAYEQKVNNIEVNIDFTPDLPEIMGNVFNLQQVFLNIIVNAEHAMLGAHGEGVITITTEQDGDNIRVSLADDGPGISKENLGHVFDPFFTTKEVGKGTGLGLSICHGTITEHGGKIVAESEPGNGATFIIEIPVATTDNEG